MNIFWSVFFITIGVFSAAWILGKDKVNGLQLALLLCACWLLIVGSVTFCYLGVTGQFIPRS